MATRYPAVEARLEHLFSTPQASFDSFEFVKLRGNDIASLVGRAKAITGVLNFLCNANLTAEYLFLCDFDAEDLVAMLEKGFKKRLKNKKEKKDRGEPGK